MKNVEVKIENGKAIITVDLSKSFGPSSTGKSIIVASTEGNQRLEGKILFGLNVYRKNE
jgi:hypothetical protein